MTTLNEAAELASSDSGLAVVSTLGADHTIQTSRINAGALGFVTYGRVKLTNLRARPQLAVTFRNGWQRATVGGTAQLAGPDDTHKSDCADPTNCDFSYAKYSPPAAALTMTGTNSTA